MIFLRLCLSLRALRERLAFHAKNAKSPQSRKEMFRKLRQYYRLILTEREFPSAALFIFEAGSHFQQPIEHLGAFRTAGAKLRVSLFMHVLQAVEFVCDV